MHLLKADLYFYCTWKEIARPSIKSQREEGPLLNIDVL